MSKFQVIPAFPSIIAVTKLQNDINEIWKDIDNIEFSETTGDDATGFVSIKMRLLNDYPEIRNLILQEFYDFKNNVLHLDTTDFNITTSWMTLTPPNGFCQIHNHRNSVYSGVIYQKPNIDANSGNLILQAPVNSTMLINKPTEYNILNSDMLTIEPDENLLVFFPSYLHHKISKHTGLENRYSIAMNFFPTGDLTHGDSSIALEAG